MVLAYEVSLRLSGEGRHGGTEYLWPFHCQWEAERMVALFARFDTAFKNAFAHLTHQIHCYSIEKDEKDIVTDPFQLFTRCTTKFQVAYYMDQSPYDAWRDIESQIPRPCRDCGVILYMHGAWLCLKCDKEEVAREDAMIARTCSMKGHEPCAKCD